MLVWTSRDGRMRVSSDVNKATGYGQGQRFGLQGQGLKPISQSRFDYDTTTTRLRRKTDMFIFARVE